MFSVDFLQAPVVVLSQGFPPQGPYRFLDCKPPVPRKKRICSQYSIKQLSWYKPREVELDDTPVVVRASYMSEVKRLLFQPAEDL